MDFDEEWKCVDTAIEMMKMKLEGFPEYDISPEEEHQIITVINNLSTQENPDLRSQIHQKCCDVLLEYTKSTVLFSLTGKQGQSLLEELGIRWRNQETFIEWFCSLLDPLFEFCEENGIRWLAVVGHEYFYNFAYSAVKADAVASAIDLINKRREESNSRWDWDDDGWQDGFCVFREIAAFSSWDDLYNQPDSVYVAYQLEFEDKILQATAEYYKVKAGMWILELSSEEYLVKLNDCLYVDFAMAIFMYQDTWPKWVKTVCHELVVVNFERLVNGFAALIRLGKLDCYERKNMQDEILSPFEYIDAPQMAYLGEVLKQTINEEGERLLQQEATNAIEGEREFSLIGKIVDLYHKYKKHRRFLGEISISILQEFFLEFYNRSFPGRAAAELFATYFCEILKKGSTGVLVDAVVETAIVFSRDTDLFAKLSKQKLATCLLSNEICIHEANKDVLQKLVQQFSTTSALDFTSQMITDMIHSEDIGTEFTHCVEENQSRNPQIELSVNVLDSRLWPTYKPFNLNLPQEMADCVDSFTEFYSATRENKKLTWIHTLGTAIVVGRFRERDIEMVVSTTQAAILLLFNDGENALSLSDIATRLRIPEEEIGRFLQPLTDAEVLMKVPNTEEEFMFNSEFSLSSSSRKIDIPPAIIVDEKYDVAPVVDNPMHRTKVIDAAIVRIMKNVKVLGHMDLVLQCVGELKPWFTPDHSTIASRIEDLIEREYLQRDEVHSQCYHYILD